MAPLQELKPIQATRASTTLLPPTDTTPSFLITKANKSYKHQYSNIYFVRLRLLREHIETCALKNWKNISGKPVLVPRVLEVIKGQLCYIIGTVYMEMPLKPNVMEDIARDHSIPTPPHPTKFYSDGDVVTLEDESGRIQLVGDALKGKNLVTGIIIGALGAETPNGEFEVVDICFAGLPPQTFEWESQENKDAMEVDDEGTHILWNPMYFERHNAALEKQDEWIGVISGLQVGSSNPADAQLQMLTEYLTGEEGGEDDQLNAARISRLIIAGDSLSPNVLADRIEPPTYDERKARKNTHDPTTFTPNPIYDLSAHLLDIARVMPIHILPGPGDPSGTIMPQQPFPKAIFGDASTKFSTFYSESNPTYINIASTAQPDCKRSILVNSGQPLNDMFKYLPTPPTSRLSILGDTLKWRHMSPTAPDTLWCHPYFSNDPFILSETPHIYLVGGQPHFGTKIVSQEGDSKQIRSRIVLVPSFAKTGTMVLVNVRTLEVKCVSFAVDGLATAGNKFIKDAPSLTPTQVDTILTAPNPSSSQGVDEGSQL